MKKRILCLAVVTLSLSIIFSACKKDNVQSSADNSSQISTQADDQAMASAESDAVLNDANTSLESSSSTSGREEDVQSLICDATVTKDTLNSTKTITITYNGANCTGNRTRTGVVTISIPAGVHWKDAGAVITINFNNLKITRVRDGKSITINGTHTVTNVTGGLLINLPNLSGITHTITSSNMSITFDDGSMRTWQVAKQRVFTYNNGIVITTTGTHTEGNNTGIETWGSTRYGNAFTNSILTALVRRQDCSYRLVSGVYQHVSVLATTDVTFGLDVNGNPTTCPGSGTYYYKAVWTGVNGKIKTVIAPY